MEPDGCFGVESAASITAILAPMSLR